LGARVALADSVFVVVGVVLAAWAFRTARASEKEGAGLLGTLAPFAIALAILLGSSPVLGLLAPGYPLFPAIRYAADALLLASPALAWTAAAAVHRRARLLALAVAAASSALALEAYVLCPHRLEVVVTHLAAPRGIRIERPIRIALVSDIQTDRVGAYEARALETAVASHPDLLVLAGDFIQVPDVERFREEAARLRPLLVRAAAGAAAGAVAVWGNVDRPVPLPELFEGTPIPLLSDESVLLKLAGVPVRVTGLSIRTSFARDPRALKGLLQPPPDGGLHILVGHAPDYARLAAPLGRADAALAGHTHGGQVVIPGIGPLMTFSRLPKTFASGTHEIGGLPVVVTKGVGMERLWAPRIRLFCPPDVTIVEIGPGI
jgi:predicted MPP superfamily phosphohydrolase